MAVALVKSRESWSARAGEAGAERAVDLAHLARQTMGNRDLEREVLHLFVRQCERTMLRFDDAAAPHADLAHVIVGSARGIGAHGVARAAARLEEEIRSGSADWRDALGELRAEVEAAVSYVRQIVSCA